MAAKRGSKKGANAWKAAFSARLPLLGHRNWIVVTDGAFPVLSSPGIETVYAGGGLLKTARYALREIERAAHLRARVCLGSELATVPEEDAPGAEAFRADLGALLEGLPVERVAHAEIVTRLNEASRIYRVLMIKTAERVPYSSVFIPLECGYWSDEAEARLRGSV